MDQNVPTNLPVGEPVLKVTVKAGDSLWKILESFLKGEASFISSGEVEKKYILYKLSEEVLSNPKKFGLKENGVLETGSVLDLSQILLSPSKISSVSKEASLMPEEMKNDISRYYKIVSDSVFYISPNSQFESQEKKVEKNLEKIDLKLEDMVEVKGVSKEAKPGISTPIVPDKIDSQVELAFVNGVNDIYGSKGFMGLGNKVGINSPEWEFMKSLPAAQVLSFYSGGSAGSVLRPEIRNVLMKSESHLNLAGQIKGMIQSTNDTIKPYDNENVATFLKRLVGFIFRNNN